MAMSADGFIQRSRSDAPLPRDAAKLVDAADATDDGATEVQCECCGLPEECTPTYIGRVRERFDGKWVCGLCSEAVQERLRRVPAATVGEALEAHASLCAQFNSTIRLNPKLSLASTMRDIARKSSKNRSSSSSPPASCAAKIGRTNSCCPRFDLTAKTSPQHRFSD